MFPNVRLMIAAIITSIVALSCGFGVFAAFRVNHEPLVRLPPVTAPLQLIAGNAASFVVVAAEPFDRRFQTSPPRRAARPTEPPTPQRDDGDGVAAAPGPSAAVPERGAAEAEKTAAAEPEPAPAVAAFSSQETPAAAAIESPTDPALPVEQATPDNEPPPASVTKAAEVVAHKPRRKAAVSGTRRTGLVAGIYRPRRSRAYAVVPFDAQYPNQDAFSQPNFQPGLQAPQPRLAQRQHRRSKDNSRPPEDTTSVAGGPFVAPPGR